LERFERQTVARATRRRKASTKMSCALKSLRLTADLQSQIGEVLRRGHSTSVASASLLPTASIAYVCAPPDFDTSSPISLALGGLCSQIETRELLVGIIADFLNRDASNLVVFEDPFAKRTDELMANTKLQWGWYEDEVYYFLPSQSSAVDTIRATLTRAMDPLRFFGLFTRSQGELPMQQVQLQADTLKGFIANSESIILGIFDGESFIQIAIREHPV
jgi:hypothetical protein